MYSRAGGIDCKSHCSRFGSEFQGFEKKKGQSVYRLPHALCFHGKSTRDCFTEMALTDSYYWVTFAHSAFHLSRISLLCSVRYGTSRLAHTISVDGLSQAFSGTV